MIKGRLIDELKARQADLYALCSRLVQIPSENPPGDTTKLAAFIRDYLVSRGIEPEWHEPMPGRPNLVASLGSGGPRVVLAGHLDEFPAGQGWTRPPFSGAVEDGRIWGRGAGDMKAGLAVALTVASLLRGMDVPLRGTLTLAFASDEETGGVWGTQWLLANVPAVHGVACLIGESSGTWSAGIGEKGVLWLRLRASGISGHAAYRQGTSAIVSMRAALRALDRLHGRRGKPHASIAQVMSRQRQAAERRWGPGTGRLAGRLAVSVGTLEGGGQVNLIPESAMAEVDLRVPPGLTTVRVEKEARRLIRQAARGSVEVEVFNASRTSRRRIRGSSPSCGTTRGRRMAARSCPWCASAIPTAASFDARGFPPWSTAPPSTTWAAPTSTSRRQSCWKSPSFMRALSSTCWCPEVGDERGVARRRHHRSRE